MLPIDAAICLSLAHRTDRRTRLTKQWNELVAKKILPDIPLIYFDAFTPSTCLVPGSWFHRPSYYATNLGHIRILERMWLELHETVFILEDDALFLPEFEKNINSFWNSLNTNAPDWLAVFFGGHFQNSPRFVSPGLMLNKGSTQSHAYIVNRPGIWRLYDHLWTCQHRVVDWGYSDMMAKDDCVYCPDPWMITTTEGYSDNLDGWKPQGT